MIEKSFKKAYDIIRSSVATFTRAANRMLKEYKQVFKTDTVSAEVIEIYNKIKNVEEAEPYSNEYDNDLFCQSYDGKAYDTCHISEQTNIAAYFDNDEYDNPVYIVDWYFYACEMYRKRVGDKKLIATSYDEIYDKTVAAKGLYRYFCTHRPPSGGAIPTGYASYEVYRYGSRYCGEATYDSAPSDDDLVRYGLVIDRDWERIRKFALDRL